MRRAALLLAVAFAAVVSVAAAPSRSHEVAQPLPAPDGHGPVALFVGGAFGAANVIALDAQGRTLAYGLGGGTATHLSVCPGGRNVAEIASRGSAFDLTIRDAASLQQARTQVLRLPGRRRPDELRCEDSAGSSVLLFARRWCCDAPDGSAVYRVAHGHVIALWNGPAYAAGVTLRIVYLCGPARGDTDTVRRLDVRSGRITTLVSLASACARFVPDSRGARLAGVASGIAGRSYITVVDLTRSPPTVKQAALRREAATGDVVWLPDRRLLFLPWNGGDNGRVVDLSLRTRSHFRWVAGSAALVDSTVFGVRDDGTLIAAKLPSGPAHTVRRLPGRPQVIVTAG